MRFFHLGAICLAASAACETAVAAPAPATATATAPATGLLAHWKCDEGQGDLIEDSSGHGHPGDLAGAAWAKGAFGTALRFGGKDSWATTPRLPDLDGSGELSLEAWVLWESGGRHPNILSGGRWAPGGFLIFVADRNCSFRMGRPGAAPGLPGAPWQEVSAPLVNGFETKRWYHLAVTFQRPVITTYVDGRKAGSVRWDHPVAWEGPLEIGRWSGPECHEGLIDEIKIFSRALGPEEVEASYAAESARRQGAAAASYTVVPAVAKPVATLENRLAKLEIDRRGRCVALIEKRSGRNLLAAPAPFATVGLAGGAVRPVSCAWAENRLHFRFGEENNVRVAVACAVADSHFTFTVEAAEGDGVESLSFVSLTPQPGRHSSPTSGAVVGDDWGVCLRAMDLRTEVSLGGSPLSLRAACAPEHGIAGARAGLVVAPAGQLRPALRDLAEAGGLPRSTLGGPWALDAEGIRGSYLFATPGERDVERWIDLAKRGGFTHLHHARFYRTLGHYEPDPGLFPNGLAGLKATVRKIHDAGLKAGMHTLTGCIEPGDPWVSPTPDKRLAADASYTLAAPVDETSETIPVLEKPRDHDVIWSYSGRGNALRIGDEIIQYSAISSSPPYGFLDCTRGAFKTAPSAHRKEERVDHLRQVYLAFYPDEGSTLVDEVAESIARVYNECEFDQIYMDGAEGMGGNHAIQVMRDAIYRRLRRPAVVEASAWDHWSWSYHSRIGAWDHPKWGLKPFTDLHCAAIANYREGALLQAQLGWWAVLGPGRESRAETPDEMEYFCAKALAFDAPSSTQGIGSPTAPANARMQEYLTMAGWYERLRLANYFPESVKARLREPGKDFHLSRDDEGRWQFLPTDYLPHEVTTAVDATGAWTVANRFPRQPLKLRLEALHAVEPCDSPEAVPVADADGAGRFTVRRAASGVDHELARSVEQVKGGPASLRFRATSKRDSRRGAWALAGMRFEAPYLSIAPCDALGVWIHGDGKGEVLNLQLTSPREHMAAFGEHYVTIDFTGWRYFELPLRERDAARHRDHEWPYSSLHGIYMVPIDRNHIDALNLYLNNLPPGDTATVYLGPIRALRTRRVELGNPTLSINGRDLPIPVALASGDYLELAAMDDCRVYDERGALRERLALPGPPALLQAGENRLSFSCAAPSGVHARAEITVVASGPALAERAPEAQIDWALLRDEYDPPRVVAKLDGRDNSWEVLCRKGGAPTPFGIELEVEEVAASDAAYESEAALSLESFEDSSRFPAQWAIRSAKPGVDHVLESGAARVRIGKAAASYAATSSLADNTGWSVRGRRLPAPLDLSKSAGVGFWLHGDGKGEAFKLQLRDPAGGWCDMVVPVDFTGWRYEEFDFARPGNLDRTRVQDVLIYYNGIPSRQTVACWIDDLRAVPKIAGLGNPVVTIGESRLEFPVELGPGDRLVADGRTCRVFRKAGAAPEECPVRGPGWTLPPGRSRVALTFDREPLPRFRVSVSLVKHYPDAAPR